MLIIIITTIIIIIIIMVMTIIIKIHQYHVLGGALANTSTSAAL